MRHKMKIVNKQFLILGILLIQLNFLTAYGQTDIKEFSFAPFLQEYWTSETLECLTTENYIDSKCNKLRQNIGGSIEPTCDDESDLYDKHCVYQLYFTPVQQRIFFNLLTLCENCQNDSDLELYTSFFRTYREDILEILTEVFPWWRYIRVGGRWVRWP